MGTDVFKLKVQRERVLSVRDRKVDLLVGAQRVRETFKGAIGGKLPAFLDLPWRRLPSDNGFNRLD